MVNRQAELCDLLHVLRLPTIAEVFSEWALLAAKDKLTHEAFLYQLCARRLNLDHLCRLNFDQGSSAVREAGGCG